MAQCIQGDRTIDNKINQISTFSLTYPTSSFPRRGCACMCSSPIFHHFYNIVSHTCSITTLKSEEEGLHLNVDSNVLARHTHHHFLIFSYFIVPTSLSSGLHPRYFPCVSITGNLFSLQNALYKCLMGFSFYDFFLHCQRSYFLPFFVFNWLWVG